MVVQYVAHTTTKSTVQQPTSVKWSMTWSVNKHLKILAALSDLSLFGPLLPDLKVAAARGNRLAQLTVNGRKMNERNCGKRLRCNTDEKNIKSIIFRSAQSPDIRGTRLQ